jgi:hypothetical protein
MRSQARSRRLCRRLSTSTRVGRRSRIARSLTPRGCRHDSTKSPHRGPKSTLCRCRRRGADRAAPEVSLNHFEGRRSRRKRPGRCLLSRDTPRATEAQSRALHRRLPNRTTSPDQLHREGFRKSQLESKSSIAGAPRPLAMSTVLGASRRHVQGHGSALSTSECSRVCPELRRQHHRRARADVLHSGRAQ